MPNRPRPGHYDPMRGVYVVDKPKPQTKPKPKPKPEPYQPPVSDVRSTGGYKPPTRRQQKLNPDAPPNTPAQQHDNQPPHPALLKVGINRSLESFNHLIDVINNTFIGRYGYQPSPGLVYDFARAPQVNIDNIQHLLQVPQSHAQAVAQGFNRNRQSTALEVANLSQDPFLHQLGQSIKQGNFSQFVIRHNDAIDQYLSDRSQTRTLLNAIYQAGGTKNKEAAYLIDVTGSLHGRQGVQQTPQLEVAGIVPKHIEKPISGFLAAVEKGVGFGLGTAGQAVGGLVFAPYGVYQLANAGRKDIQDVFTRGDFTPNRTGDLIKAIGESTYDVYRHPTDNLGYIILDGFGLATGAAGVVGRVAAATKAAGARQGAVAVTRALVKRPLPGTKTLSKGGIVEESLLSDNTLIRGAQRLSLDIRQHFSDVRHEKGYPYPSGLLSSVIPASADNFIFKNLSFETKLGRLARQRRRTEVILADEIKRELEHQVGRSVNQSRAFARLPKVARKGLTRGEHKAIQVIATDDPTPLQTMRAFHRDMIEKGIGDRAAHQRQLADLKLAEKVLNDPNPRPRFLKALQLTRDVVAEMERIKIDDLGLSPITAESRVAAAGKVLRGEEITTGKQFKADSFYVPFVSKARTKRAPKYPFEGVRRGPLGAVPPRTPAELNHIFSGKSLLLGDSRVDAANLVGEAYGRTVRASILWKDWQRLWGAGTDTPKSEWDVPVRNVKVKPPKRLREVLQHIDEGQLTASDLEALTHDEIKSLRDYAFPSKKEAERIPGVRWVHPGLVSDSNRLPAIPGTFTKAGQLINEPFRDITLFLRPAYALNFLGNSGMIMMQSLASPVNVLRGTFGEAMLGGKNMRTIDELVGQGRSRSYVAPNVSAKVAGKDVLAVGKHLSSAWNVVTDKVFRRASFIYWARRYGFKNKEQMDALLHNKENLKRLNEIKLRANKDLVEFDNLTWHEKNVLRHIVFVYPWVSRSLVWSIRTMVEHPIKTDALVKLGQYAHENEDPVLKHVPLWMEQSGYFPVSWTPDGKPKIINPTSINSFSTLSQLLDTANAAFLTNMQYSSIEDLFGPAAKFSLHAASGKDQFGNDYPGPDVFGAFKDIVLNLPQASAYRRANKQNPPLSKINLTDRETLIHRENSALHRTAFSPGWLDGYGSIIAGGLSARTLDPEATAARWWASQPLEARHKHEQRLINKVLQMQGKFLKQDVPKDVQAAVDFNGQLTLAKAKEQQKLGRAPTQAESLVLEIKMLADAHHINRVEEVALLQKLKKIDASELDSFAYKVAQKRPGTNSLRDWDSNVRLLYSFRRKVLNEKIAALHRAGLTDKAGTNVSQKKLFDYGRSYMKYLEEAKNLRAQVKLSQVTSPDDINRVYAELDAWQQKHDKPGPGGLPSLVRLSWSYVSDKSQASAILYNSTRPWEFMSNFDKELLGRKPNKTVAAGNAYIAGLIEEEIKASPNNQLPGYKRREQLYKFYDAYYPGLWQDYQFGQKPLADRLLKLNTGKSRDLKDLLKVASNYATYIGKEGYTSGGVQRDWRNYIEGSLMPYLQNHIQLANEINAYGGPTFLDNLIKR